jgi:hypothetical protein
MITIEGRKTIMQKLERFMTRKVVYIVLFLISSGVYLWLFTTMVINVQYWHDNVSKEKCLFVNVDIHQISNPEPKFGLFATYEYNETSVYHMYKSSHDKTHLIQLVNTTHAVGTLHNCYYNKDSDYILFSKNIYVIYRHVMIACILLPFVLLLLSNPKNVFI